MILTFHPRNGGQIVRPEGPDGGKCLNTWIDGVSGWDEFPIRNGHTTQIGFVAGNKVLVCSALTGRDTNECYEADISADLSSDSRFTAHMTKVEAKMNINPKSKNVNVWRHIVENDELAIEKLENVDLVEDEMSALYDSGRAQVNPNKYWIVGGNVLAPVKNHNNTKVYQLEIPVCIIQF